MNHYQRFLSIAVHRFGECSRTLLPLKNLATASIVIMSMGLTSLADANTCELVKDIDFNNRNGSYQTYTQAMATNDFGTLEKNAAGDVRGLDRPGKTWLARNKVGNGHLRAHYPPNIAGGLNSGILFDQKFSATDEAVLQYRLKFSKDFVWASGGKLPGLGGSPSRIPVGCVDNVNTIKNGFSSRLMWRKNGKLVAYTYFPNRLDRNPVKCGIDYEFAQVQADKWYTVRQTIKLNTPGQKNGLLKMEIDGNVGLELNDVEYRVAGKSNVRINDLVFHTYRGGGATDTRFHSPNNDYVQMDDFKVWRDCLDPDEEPTPPVEPPVEQGDLSCSTAHSDLNRAKEKFADSCSAFVRADCDQTTIAGQNLWLCSSRVIEENVRYSGITSGGSVTLQAEDYSRAVDATQGNKGGVYRSGDVDIQATSDTGGGYNVGWISAGESLTFDVYNASTRNTDVQLRLASPVNTGLFSLLVDGNPVVSNQSVNYTGDYHDYATSQFNLGQLSAGHHVVTFKVENGPFNINWLKLIPTNNSEPTDPVDPVEPETCHSYSGSSKVELDLTDTTCVDLSVNLNGKTLSVWDSDSNNSCNFRGNVTSQNGVGSLSVDANYATTTSMSGTRIKFQTTDGCSFVKMRVY